MEISSSNPPTLSLLLLELARVKAGLFHNNKCTLTYLFKIYAWLTYSCKIKKNTSANPFNSRQSVDRHNIIFQNADASS